MTKPRVARSQVKPEYRGRFAATDQQEQYVKVPDGSGFVVPIYYIVNADDDPGLLERLGDGSLNRVRTPSGAAIDLAVPVIVNSPSEDLLVQVIPHTRRKDQLKLRISFLEALDREESPPDYFVDFVTVVGPFGPSELARLVEERRVGRDVMAERARLRDWQEELEAMESFLEGWSASLGKRSDSTQTAPPTEDTAVDRVSPYVVRNDEPEELTTSEIELLTDAGDGEELSSLQQERGVLKQVTDLPERAPRPASQSADETLFSRLRELPLGQGLALAQGDRVTVHFVVDSDRLAPFLARRPDLFLQLHLMPNYPIVSLLLVASDDMARLVDELFAVIEIDQPDHQAILDSLERRFALDVHLYDEQGRRLEYLQYAKPLESNVVHLRTRGRAFLEGLAPADRDFLLALQQFSSEGYERVGARRHNFTEDSFLSIQSAGSARLAVSMVSYWSEPQNTHYLIENRSFPLSTFQAIQRRVVEGALEYGIHLTRELREVALASERAVDERTLLEDLAGTFASVSTRLDCDLDSMARSENWDQLLSTCIDLGASVDERIRELASQARRRSRASSTGESVAEVDETGEYERMTSMSQASNEDLRNLLRRGGIAPAATRELLGRGGSTNIFHVIDAARVLDEDALQSTARFLAAGAEQFEPALLIGLGNIHHRTVHLCALALAMAKRVEALPALVELLHDDTRSQGIPVRDIVAEYGADGISAVFDAIEERGATDRLVECLALISIDFGADIIQLLRERPTPPLLGAAQRMGKVRKELESRPLRSVPAEVQDNSDEGGFEP